MFSMLYLLTLPWNSVWVSLGILHSTAGKKNIKNPSRCRWYNIGIPSTENANKCTSASEKTHTQFLVFCYGSTNELRENFSKHFMCLILYVQVYNYSFIVCGTALHYVVVHLSELGTYYIEIYIRSLKLHI